jgi:hypothetical protein
MTRRYLTTVSVSLCLGILLIFFLVGAESADEIQRVFVTNFPRVQQVAGSVSIEGTIRHGVFHRFKEIVVPPVNPSDVSHLIPGGTLEADGFTSMVLALNGQSKGRMLKSGSVGAILLPDEESVLRVYEEEGKAQFPIEIRTAVFTMSSPSSASSPQQFQVGFPRYRIWLYNTSDSAVSTNLFAYLTN